MSKIDFKELMNIGLNSLFRNLGTNTGTFISVLTLLGMGFSSGIYYNDYKKNIEILDIKKAAFTELKELKDQNHFLSIEVKEIKAKHDLLLVEINELNIKSGNN